MTWISVLRLGQHCVEVAAEEEVEEVKEPHQQEKKGAGMQEH